MINKEKSGKIKQTILFSFFIKMSEQNNWFDWLVFHSQSDFNSFEAILETLDSIKPQYISREEFRAKKWNFLEKTWNQAEKETYILFLPKDIKINELPSIIKKVNQITFWEKLPDYASSNELKYKIIYILDTFMNKLSKDQNNAVLKSAISKYIQLYQSLFPDENIQLLNNKDYRKNNISKSDNSQFKQYETKILSIKTQEDLSNLLWEMEDVFSVEILHHFKESFFEKAVNNLRLWMKTVTKEEQLKMKAKKREVVLHSDPNLLDTQEKFLREKIGIDALKKELEILRKSWNTAQIEKKEIQASNKILKTLYTLPYQLTSNDYWYQPSKILSSKELACVGFSLLWHAFLSELGIQHNGLDIPGHSALEIIIWNKRYYFDGTIYQDIHEFEYGKNAGSYKEIILKDIKKEYELIAIAWDVEKMLSFQIANNKATSVSNEIAVNIYDSALALFPNNSTTYNNKWVSLRKLWKYNESIEAFKKGLEYDPNDYLLYANIWYSLFQLWKYEEALKIYDRALGINKNDFMLLNEKWNCLMKMKQFEEARIFYMQAIKLESKYSTLYKNVWDAYFETRDLKLSYLYYFTANSLDAKNDSFFVQMFYNNEKKQIKDYIWKEDYDGLKKYLFSLEK